MAKPIPTPCKAELRARRDALKRRNRLLYDALFMLGGMWQLQKMLMKQGRTKFGAPTPEQADELQSIIDLDHLHRLALRLLQVNSWDALLRGR